MIQKAFIDNRCALGMFFLATFAVIPGIVMGEQMNSRPDDDPPPRPIEKLVKDIAKGENTPGAALSEHLRVLCEVEPQSRKRFYVAIIKELAKAKTPKSLPVLETLLNDKQFLEGDMPQNKTNVFFAVRKVASSLWYDLKWRNASEKEKLSTALYGLHPKPPVHLDPEASVARLLTLGNSARPAVFQLLADPDLEFSYSWWEMRAVAESSDLLNKKPFIPTDDEMVKILKQKGEFGRVVMLAYSLQYRPHKRTAGALRRWFMQNRKNPLEVVILTNNAADYEDAPPRLKSQLAKVLIDIGGYAQKIVVDQTGELMRWGQVLYTINFDFYKIEPGDKVKAFLHDYLKFDDDLQLKFPGGTRKDYIRNVKTQFDYARMYARKALRTEKVTGVDSNNPS